jgi:hypothetical protein
MADPQVELWEAYHLIFRERETWEDSRLPYIIADDEAREIPEDEWNEWKEKTRQVAVSNYHLVLEDVSDLSDWSDEGE